VGTRRGNNEGSITKVGKRWQARVDLGYIDGRRVRKAYYGATRKEAAEKLKAALAQQQQNLPLPNEVETVGAFLERWITDDVKPRLRPKTSLSYEYIVRMHLVPRIGRVKLARLGPEHVTKLMADCRKAGLSVTTTRYARTVLRIALGKALRWGLVGRNVATLVDPPAAVTREVEPLSPNQARMLLDTLAGHRSEALFTVALALGLREGEALGLKWADINLTTRTLKVRRQLQRIDKKLVFTEPKTKQSKRTIVLPQIVAERLREHRDRQAFEKSKAADRWQEQDLVFPTRYGTPTHPENLCRSLHTLLKKAGLPQCRFHDLRHACASLLLAQGLSLKDIQATLGHSQISTTADIYAHMIDERRAHIADQMDAIFRAAD
jgi:integrase